MNLKELIEEVNSALDYNPDLEAYKSQVSRVINRHYLQISSQYPWLFRQKTVPLTLRADIKGSADSRLMVGRKEHYGSSNVLYFEGTTDVSPEIFVNPEMLGNTLVIEGNETITDWDSIAHGSSEREFTVTAIFDHPSEDPPGHHFNTITETAGGLVETDFGSGKPRPQSVGYEGTSRAGGMVGAEFPDGHRPGVGCGIVIDRPLIDPSTVAYVTSTDTDFATATGYNSDGSYNSDRTITKKYYEDWSIEFRKYYLPEDCIEVLGIVDRGLKSSVHSQTTLKGQTVTRTSTNTAPDRGRLIFIDSAKEEQLYLDRDSPGDPVIGIEGMPTYVTPPQDAPIVIGIEGGRYDGGELHANALSKAYTLAYNKYISEFMMITPGPVLTKPGLLYEAEYEYCYTFVEGGVESAPSPVTRLPAVTNNREKFRYAVIHSESTQGNFLRNGQMRSFPERSHEELFYADIPTHTRGNFDHRSESDREGDAVQNETPITGDKFSLNKATRFTGRLKRFYRRKVPPTKAAMEQIYGGTLPSSVTHGVTGVSEGFDNPEILSAYMGHRHQGNGGWMHIGDQLDDSGAVDVGIKQQEFVREHLFGHFKNNWFHEFQGPTFLGWPQSYWMMKGYWTYHDGELQKIRRLDETGPRQSIRIYRPPSRDMDIEIRYLSRPKRLVANGDTPEWPPQYHHLLVYMALADICLQHGMNNQATLYQRKSEDLLDRMKQKYLSRTNRKYVRQGFSRSIMSGERFGIPSKV